MLVDFQAYRHELQEAYDCCMKYKKTGKDAELTQVTYVSGHDQFFKSNLVLYFLAIPNRFYEAKFPEMLRVLSQVITISFYGTVIMTSASYLYV